MIKINKKDIQEGVRKTRIVFYGNGWRFVLGLDDLDADVNVNEMKKSRPQIITLKGRIVEIASFDRKSLAGFRKVIA